ncbi:unnamed protein product [Lactuca virosa]|uniref:Uncharacterized protein n=1 Tax=Lactuca virosa TaxID=75947 RepID=A0AAU9PTJ9_9ASTR|nr:unnamed protein product [Lactuca virosa]
MFLLRFNIKNGSDKKTVVSISTTKRRRHTGTNNYNKKLGRNNISRTEITGKPVVDDNYSEIRGKQVDKPTDRPVSLRSLSQNSGPLGRKDLGKSVVKWISHVMKAMATDFGEAEFQGEFSEVRQRMGPCLTFIIQAQPYIGAILMPPGLEFVCLKAYTLRLFLISI